jgi:hypothetical protein
MYRNRPTLKKFLFVSHQKLIGAGHRMLHFSCIKYNSGSIGLITGWCLYQTSFNSGQNVQKKIIRRYRNYKKIL